MASCRRPQTFSRLTRVSRRAFKWTPGTDPSPFIRKTFSENVRRMIADLVIMETLSAAAHSASATRASEPRAAGDAGVRIGEAPAPTVVPGARGGLPDERGTQ